MKIDTLPTYQDVCDYLDKQKNRPKHLLLGNGFSMAYSSAIFSYNALYSFIDNLDNEVLSKLFHIVNTSRTATIICLTLQAR